MAKLTMRAKALRRAVRARRTRALDYVWDRWPTSTGIVRDLTHVGYIRQNARWYWYLWTRFGRRAKQIVRVGALESLSAFDSLSSRIKVWGSEVDNCVDVALGDENSDLVAVADYEATLDTRHDIDEALADLPADMRDELTAWLASGPDARFTSLTEPDADQLLRRAGVVDLAERHATALWASRVPRRGFVRAALERHASRGDEYNAEGDHGDD